MSDESYSDIYYKIDVYKNYIYCVRRTYAGTVCCYIDVARDSRFDNIISDESILEKLLPDAHGGITYCSHGFPPIRSKDIDPYCQDTVIGYDYGHSYDIEFGMLDGFARVWSVISEKDAEKELFALIDKLADI